MSTVFSSHQPNILPYMAFWKKVADSHIFDIAIYDDYSNSAYINYCTFGDYGEKGEKIQLKLKHSNRIPIFNLMLKDGTQSRFHDRMIECYKDFPYADSVLPALSKIFDTQYTYMWELNFRLLVEIRDLLGLETQFVLSERNSVMNDATSEIIRICEIYRADVYISGMKGREYLDIDKFNNNGIEVRYQDGWTADKNSILTTICRHGLVETYNMLKGRTK